MGEVYKAQDTRLERTVAIKVLTANLSSSPELRQRFEREAKTISKLSHPNICALYDVGQSDGTDFLVMEYLEGETLAHRLARGSLPADQVLRYGMEMAKALDQAHRQGIVHRDMKPGNVMLCKSGVKLLDFGLAKAIAPVIPPSDATSAPTAPGARDLTQSGAIVGTIQYMAPEQLEGREADARTDIFALGAVLYEMAAGRKSFAGTTPASVIVSIMQDEPAPITTIQPMVPRALDRVIRICLSKDPEERWQSAHDIAAELKWIAEGSEAGVAPPRGVSASRRSRERLAWAGLVLASLIAVGLAVAYVRRAPAPPRILRFEIAPSETALYDVFGDVAAQLALSPDGRLLTFVAQDPQGKVYLWVRPLDSLDARPVAGSEGAELPFWSPDSRSIGFFAEKKLKRIDPSGGPVQILCDAPAGRGGTWNRDGVILFAPNAEGPIHRIAASGGAPAPVLPLDAAHGEVGQHWPSFLPDGRHFLYLSSRDANPASRDESGGVRIGSVDSKETRLVMPEASNAAYVEPGQILFYRGGNLLAQPFDTSSLKTTGDAVPIAGSVAYSGIRKFAFFSASSAGVLVYARAATFPGRLLWFDRRGRQVGSVGGPGAYSFPRLSPDGRRLAVAFQDGPKANIWIFDVARGARTRFSLDVAWDEDWSVWSPDGGRLAYKSVRAEGEMRGLFLRSIGTTVGEQALLKTPGNALPTDWSRDGRFVAYSLRGEKTGWDIWVLPLEGDRKPFPFLQTAALELNPTFSPDGRWIAYDSYESGQSDVYVAPFPGPGDRIAISTAGGRTPRWRGDGKELFYLAADGTMMAVPIRPGVMLEAGVPVPLFETRLRKGSGSSYDVAADGQRFLVVTRVFEKEVPPFAVVVDWMAGLKK